MYRAKQNGKNCICWIDVDSCQKEQTSLETIKRAKQALDSNELTLFYQPKVNILKYQVIGFKTLLRWHHPEHGIIPPAEFLPVVEQSDLIIEIGEWVINQAMAQLPQWKKRSSMAYQHKYCITPLSYR